MLAKLADFSLRRPRLILGLWLMITLFAGICAGRLVIDTKIHTLLPHDMAERHLSNIKLWGHDQYLLVILRHPQGKSIRPYLGFLREARQRVDTSAFTQGLAVQSLLPDQEAVYDFEFDYGILTLDPESLDKLEQRLAPDTMKEKLADAKSTWWGEWLWKGLFRKKQDPLRLSRLVVERHPLNKSLNLSSDDSILITRDRTSALLVFKVSHMAEDREATAQMQTDISKLLNEVWHDQQERNHIRDSDKLEDFVRLSGSQMLFYENHRLMTQEFWIISTSAIVAVILLFWLFFRSWLYLLLAIGTVGSATLWTLGLASLAFGELNLASIALVAITMGLGIDFTIHLLMRYRKERIAGHDIAEAIRATWSHTGRGVVFGALTTSLVFFLLCIADLPAFRELGILMGVGVLLCAGLALILLPAGLCLIVLHPVPHAARTRSLSSFNNWVVWPIRHAGPVFIISALLWGASLWQLPRLDFEFSQEHLHSRDNQSWQALRDLEKALNLSLSPLSLFVSGPTWEEAAATEQVLKDQLQRLKQEGLFLDIAQLSDWVPHPTQQARVRKQIAASETLAPEQFRRHYQQIVTELDLNTRDLTVKYPALIQRFLTVPGELNVDTLDEYGLESIKETHLRREAGGVALRTHVYLEPRLLRRDSQRRFLAALHRTDLYRSGDIGFVSIDEVAAQVETLVARNAQIIFLLGLALVYGLCLVAFRSWRWAIYALIPVLFGGVVMLAAMSLTPYPLDFVNMLWIPMIYGLGIDDGIHFLVRLREEKGDIQTTLRGVARPIILTSFTTIASFSSLMLSSFPALQGAGLLIAIGMTATLLASLFLLPALCHLAPLRSE